MIKTNTAPIYLPDYRSRLALCMLSRIRIGYGPCKQLMSSRWISWMTSTDELYRPLIPRQWHFLNFRY